MNVRKTPMVPLLSPKQMLSSAFFLCQLLFSPFLLHCSATDTITNSNSLSDGRGETLVSLEGNFELGFFTPNGSSGRRYLGVWYYLSDPPVVVWIANRDNPLSSTDGTFVFGEDGNLKVLDGGGRSCWSTNLEPSTSINRKAKIMDTGNMVISDKGENDGSERIVWQSFENPTDTFLPGMKMEQGMALTSWKSYNDPASGNFTFELDQEANQFVVWKRSMKYWMSENFSKDGISGGMPSAIYYFLSNFTSSLSHNFSIPYISSSLYANTRMVMRFSGQIQYLKWDSQKIWSLIWEEPRTRCSLYNACGNFGSCNSYNELACNCLPGFQPTSPEYWISGDYSGGCTRSSPLCSDSTKRDTFLKLTRMKVANPDSQFKARDEQECKMECLNNCQCQAFSFEKAQTIQNESETATCWIWLEDLRDLQEEYDGGRDLNVHVKVPGIESISRSCGTCSTNIIPYPLSTGPGCGDPMYFNFHCNISTGQLSFEEQGSIYKVTMITPETRKILLRMANMESCKAFDSNEKLWQLNQSSPYKVIRWCNSGGGNFPVELSSTGSNEVEITWNPPSEPTCSSSGDCRDWPNSTCVETRDGKRNCICNKKFRWDGLDLNCTREGHQTNFSSATNVSLPLVIVIASASVVVLLVLTSYIICIYLQRKKLVKVQGTRGIVHQRKRANLYQSQKLVKDIIDSSRFNEDETKAIDVPHFDLESILAATRNFSNAYKLGQGGFGTVYKAKFAGGEEIAVKRLSSCSSQGMKEFKNEVMLIAKLQHRNLVRLLGYCIEEDENILLYEYMSNKSLDSFIFEDQKLCTRLDWDMRYNIIIGITRGLLYLHQDSRLRIIHRDLKTSNILLDEEMNPKISDFGLARIFEGKETAANTNRVVGTYGYIAPEYALDGLFSFKSDVFSFGIVVLEIISGKRNTGSYQVEQSLSLLGYAWNLWTENKPVELLDKTLCRSRTYNRDEFLKCLNVGLLCVQEDPGDRPTMSNVLSMLGSDTVALPSPKQPAFVVRRCPSNKASTSSKPDTCSQNGLTVTLEDGR